MAVIFDAVNKYVSSGNTVALFDIGGPARLLGISVGKQNGNYSDMVDSMLNLIYDNNSENIPTKYTNIDNIITEKLNFKFNLKVVMNPFESSLVNAFVMYDDLQSVPTVENVVTKYFDYNINPGNTIDIPVISSTNIVLYGIMFTGRDNGLLFTLDTGNYLFKNKPTMSIPRGLNNLSIAGDRIFVSLENNSSNAISGTMVIIYGFR